jgi:hypothetical protein
MSMPLLGMQVATTGATSPSVTRRMRAPAARSSLDEVLVARAVEDDDGELVGAAALGGGEGPQVVARRLLERDLAA